MKIHVWGINYSPEVTGIGPYNAALCEWLAQHGHEVEMVTTFCYYPAWRKLPGEERLLSRTDQMEGVTVHRCWHYVPKQVSTARRILHELSFVCASFLRMLFLSRPDLIIAISPPLLLGPAAWLISVLKRTRFVFHIQDLQPSAAAGLGMLRNGSLLFRFLQWIEQFTYSKAVRVSAITPGMLRHVTAAGAPGEKLLLFMNGVDLPDFWRLPEKNRFRREHGISSTDFLVVYSGNLGRKQGLDLVIDAARLVRNPKIRFLICGDGAERETLQKRAANLPNVQFIPLQAEARYRELLVDADLCVIPQQAGCSGESFFPSKLLKTLAYSAPVLTISEPEGELDRAVQEGAFGRNVPPGSPEKIATQLDDLSSKPDLLREWGRAGFKFVKRFDQAAVLNEFTSALENLITSNKPDPR